MLVLPLAPGAVSLMLPELLAVVLPLALGAVELLVLLPAGEVVVVVVVVVWLEALVEPLVPLVLLLALEGAPLCQSPCSFTEWPTCADRSCVLEMLAILPFFSCSM